MTTFVTETTAPIAIRESSATPPKNTWDALMVLLPSDAKITPPERNIALRAAWHCPSDLPFPLGVHVAHMREPMNVANELIAITESPMIEDQFADHVQRGQWKLDVIEKASVEVRSLYAANILRAGRFQMLASISSMLERRGLLNHDITTYLREFSEKYRTVCNTNEKSPSPVLFAKQKAMTEELRKKVGEVVGILIDKGIDYSKLTQILIPTHV